MSTPEKKVVPLRSTDVQDDKLIVTMSVGELRELVRAEIARAQPKPEKTLDLDALSADITKMAKAQPARPSSAARGPARPETAQQARPALGNGAASAAAIQGLAEDLQRRWNPNCDVEGGRDVLVRVTFVIGAGGQVQGDVSSEVRSARNAVSQVAANRAVSAVYAAAPFRNLPREFYGERVSVNFNAREACSG